MTENQPAERAYPSRYSEPGRAVWLTALLLVGLLVAFFAAGGAAAENEPAAENTTVVRCDPVLATGLMNQFLNVDIYVENVVDLNAADIRLSFDPSMVQVYDADPQASGVQILILDDLISPDFILRKNADNVAGTIWYAATQVQRDPVSGSGPLARITFQPLQAGSFTMPITYQKLAEPDSTEIEATAIDCQITILDTEAIPPLYIPVVMGKS